MTRLCFIHRLTWCIFLVLAALGSLRLALAQDVGEIVSALGTVEVLRQGRWQPVTTGEKVVAGETIKTGTGSRIALQMANGAQLKINANSQLELKQIIPQEGSTPSANASPTPNILHIPQGEIWVRSNGIPLELHTIPVVATIRGTEFNLAVSPDHLARLAVFEGLIEFHNPQGSVLVEANEQATARFGEKPRKTVLLNPLDAAQWSLYYPGTVSYRDYPLAGQPAGSPTGRSNRRQVAADQTPVEPLIRQAEVRFDSGDHAQAQQLFAQALQHNPHHPRARTGLGWTLLEAGAVDAALVEFQKVRPPTLMSAVGSINGLYQLNRFTEADQVIAATQKQFPQASLPWVQAALNALIRGRVSTAQHALDQALARDAHSALAQSLRSNIYLVQNQKAQAREAAKRALAANPQSPTAYLSLSLVEQADFQLSAALDAARQATALDPHNPQALIQESRLLFGMGDQQQALNIARKARERTPQDALISSTWGFLQLAQGHTQDAITAFQDAITQDSTLGEPHLGLGIALFRQNDTKAATEEIRKATLLEPTVSLYSSYLGKAFFETQHNELAAKYFAHAKRLDPHDPTPHFYDAIRLQINHQPVKAVESLQTSLNLNDNRAVYRSKLLLDQDLAVRATALGRTYNELGFSQLGLNEGVKSLTLDPANHSAHRLLADSYAVISDAESARTSELLQSQLLQPINITPVSPQMAETKLLIPEPGPITPSLYEFNPLFIRNRPTLYFMGLGGSQEALGNELLVAGITDRFSYSLGQFHYRSNGYRPNNDLENNLYSLFAQTAVTPSFSIQGEYRYRETISGDQQSSFDGSFSPFRRRDIEQKTTRIGANYSPTPNINLLTSVIYTDRENQLTSKISNFRFEGRNKGTQAETQLIYRDIQFNMISGLGIYSLDVTGNNDSDGQNDQSIIYNYTNIKTPYNAVWTIGFSYETDKSPSAKVKEFNPKLGLQWAITDQLSLRAAAFKVVKRALAFEQTIEPTQIAQFNQMIDYVDTTVAENYGAALDIHFNDHLVGGLEALRRDTEVPLGILSQPEFYEIVSNREYLYSAYLYWLPSYQWALSASLRYEKFEPDQECKFCLYLYPAELKTFSLPLSIQHFDPSGFFGGLSFIYIHQDMRSFDRESFSILPRRSENFTLTNATLGYRFPKRRGLFTLQINNLFDKEFNYQDYSFQTTNNLVNPRYIPERTFNARLIFNF